MNHLQACTFLKALFCAASALHSAGQLLHSCITNTACTDNSRRDCGWVSLEQNIQFNLCIMTTSHVRKNINFAAVSRMMAA